MAELGLIAAIAVKDLIQEYRSRAVTVATVFFAAIVLLILAFAFSEANLLALMAPGALWVALAFAGVISAAQSYQAELEEGALEQLLIYPIPRASIYLGKLVANWLYMSALGALLLPVSGVLFNLPLQNGLWLLVTVLLGTFGFALIATFYAALTANLRARESLLPVLMFPVVAPILLAAVRASSEIVGPGNLAVVRDWLQLLLGFDLVYLVICSAMFHFITEA